MAMETGFDLDRQRRLAGWLPATVHNSLQRIRGRDTWHTVITKHRRPRFKIRVSRLETPTKDHGRDHNHGRQEMRHHVAVVDPISAMTSPGRSEGEESDTMNNPAVLQRHVPSPGLDEGREVKQPSSWTWISMLDFHHRRSTCTSSSLPQTRQSRASRRVSV
ncbi:hypothetical protein GQ607_000441 [Colletotrichum asianum]|uniref:Uncharacterized protein n=1 Tax=Colletotrichum asianum TaxID=702518 RepID=A0A8H3ZZB0_9PEZI|nr:hypothetical protein GQ607_000441 [Colletotrichum asianum]